MRTRAPRTTNGLYKSADDDANARKSSSMCARRTQSQVPLALPLATITRTVARWLAFAVRNSYGPRHRGTARPLHATVRCPRCRNPTLSLGYGPLGLPGLLSHWHGLTVLTQTWALFCFAPRISHRTSRRNPPNARLTAMVMSLAYVCPWLVSAVSCNCSILIMWS